MKTKIIINPISGTQKHKNIDRIFEKYLKDYEIVYTKYQNHAFEISKKLDKKFDRVIVAGGDGTVNECVRGLIDKDITLATLPCGSVNGFSLHNNIDTNLDNAIKSLANYKEIKSDVWTINDNPFINVSGTGFDALIANCFSKLKNRGFSSYINNPSSTNSSNQSDYLQLNIDTMSMHNQDVLSTQGKKIFCIGAAATKNNVKVYSDEVLSLIHI